MRQQETIAGNQTLRWDELADLLGNMHMLVRGGMPLAPSIATMAQQLGGKRGRAVAEALQSDIEKGLSLTEAMDRQPAAFPPLYRSMMKAAEASGNLGQVLSTLTTYSRSMAEIRNEILETLTYPLVLVVAAFGLFMFMLLKVVPVFVETLLQDAFTSPPPMMIGNLYHFFVWLSTFVQESPILITALFFAIFTLAIWICVPRPGQGTHYRWVDRVRISLPLFGKINAGGAKSQFCRVLGMLIEAQTPLPEALVLASAASGNKVFEIAGQNISKRVCDGDNFGQALVEEPTFDSIMSWTIENGEKNNDLPATLNTLAEHYEEVVSRQRRWLLWALAPVTIVTIGILVLFMFIGIYGPLLTGLHWT